MQVPLKNFALFTIPGNFPEKRPHSLANLILHRPSPNAENDFLPKQILLPRITVSIPTTAGLTLIHEI